MSVTAREEPFRYDTLAERPRVRPGALVRCGACGRPHALEADLGAPRPGALLYYSCAGANGRGPAANTRHLGALGGWLVDGLGPLPLPESPAPPPPVPNAHEHLCPACARMWRHPQAACRRPGMVPKRCEGCQARLAATLARWAYVQPAQLPTLIPPRQTKPSRPGRKIPGEGFSSPRRSRPRGG